MKNPTNCSGSTLEVQEYLFQRLLHSKSLGKSLAREYFSSDHQEKNYSFKYKVTVVNNCKSKLSPQNLQLLLHNCNFLPFLFPASEDPSLILNVKIYKSDSIWVTKPENQQLQKNYEELWDQALVFMMGPLEEPTLTRLSPMKVMHGTELH